MHSSSHRPLRRFRLQATAAALLLVLLGTTVPLRAVAGTQSWRPVRALRFFVGETVDRASRVYRSGGYYLVEPSAGEQVYVLAKRDLQVFALGREELRIDAGVPVLEVAALAAQPPSARFEKQDRGRWLVWSRGETRLAVGPRPELRGPATLAEVLEEKPKYREAADAYEPDAAAVSAIHDAASGVGFVVGFGTWCPICAQWTPRLIKTLEAAAIDPQQMLFIAIDPDVSEPAAVLEQYGIDGVPTFIVRRQGKEVGRLTLDDIDAEPELRVERRIAKLLGAGGEDAGS